MATDLASGVLLVNKPIGMTSHDVVDRVRSITGQRKIGHAGTLDPLASGLLVVCLGGATKVSRYLAGNDKSYRGTIRMGQTSLTYDREGIEASGLPVPVPGMTLERIDSVLDRFRGTFEQKVPLYSAVSVDGQRLHEVARKGEVVDTPTREVSISSLKIVAFSNPDVALDITCSKGTYIRSLAHDVGQALGCGAYLENLVRTGAGKLTIEDALTLDDINSRWESQRLRDDLRTVAEALDFPALVVDDSGREAVSCGKDFQGRYISAIESPFRAGQTILVKNDQGQVLAVGEAQCDSDRISEYGHSTMFKYARVLA